MANTQGIRAGRAFVELGTDDAKLLRGLRRAQRRLKAFGASVRSIGAGMVRASAAAVTPFAASGVVFARFEQRMARVKALTGATGKDFRRQSDEAKRLGESTVFSASQAADAMSFFALAGFDVEQILKAIGPTLNLAAAGQLEIAQAADIAAKIMAGMGIEADNLEINRIHKDSHRSWPTDRREATVGDILPHGQLDPDRAPDNGPGPLPIRFAYDGLGRLAFSGAPNLLGQWTGADYYYQKLSQNRPSIRAAHVSKRF